MNISFETLKMTFFIFVETYGVKVLIILLLFLFGRFGLKKIIKKVTHVVSSARSAGQIAIVRRTKTLESIVLAVGNILLYGIVFLMAINLCGVNTTPILTGAGIIGLAVGFGSQTLVKDFVSGLLILIENQYNIGDRIKVGSFEGVVEKITVRSTVLKDDNGNFYYLSNGTINNVINFSQNIESQQKNENG
ncbi:MAG: mechanosensitive ion channel domain-containing protein [bacterium]